MAEPAYCTGERKVFKVSSNLKMSLINKGILLMVRRL